MSSQRGEPANDGGRATPSLRSFRSAIDGWMVALFVIPTGFALLMVIPKAGLNTRPGLIAAAVMLGGGVLLPAVLYAITGYQLTDTELVVRVGPFTTRIPYSQIQSIEPSRDVESAPAWSLHRLRVAYGTGQYVLISPTPREAFLESIEMRRRSVVSVRRSSQPEP